MLGREKNTLNQLREEDICRKSMEVENLWKSMEVELL